MTDHVWHISVCICTFKRPGLLKILLEALDRQKTEGLFTYSVVVADNDRFQSAKHVVLEFAGHSAIPVTYCIEAQQNIALARNRALANANGDFIAFIDDDEYPDLDWLYLLFTTCHTTGADGVLGPVIPYFEQEPPKWAQRGRFFERPAHETGYKIGLTDARTGNVMFRSKIFDGSGGLFRVEFGTGGEDLDFFQRMMDSGRTFIWCNEAVVHEVVPMTRCTRSYLLRRALHGGDNSLKFRSGRLRSISKSLVAIPVYAMMLPFLFVLGDHYFMKYILKLSSHAGKLLALIRIHPFREYK